MARGEVERPRRGRLFVNSSRSTFKDPMASAWSCSRTPSTTVRDELSAELLVADGGMDRIRLRHCGKRAFGPVMVPLDIAPPARSTVQIIAGSWDDQPVSMEGIMSSTCHLIHCPRVRRFRLIVIRCGHTPRTTNSLNGASAATSVALISELRAFALEAKT